MIGVNITTNGLENLALKVTRRANFLTSSGMATQVLQPAGKELVRIFQANIDSFTPGSVQDLKEKTKIQKQRQVGFVYPILIRTRALYNSMRPVVTRPIGGGGWGLRMEFTGSQNGISNSRLAEIHINGEGRMPPRDFTKIPRSFGTFVITKLRMALARL